MIHKISRRFFLYLSLIGLTAVSWPLIRRTAGPFSKPTIQPVNLIKQSTQTNNQPVSHIYVAKNGTPEQNVAKVIEMMGGMERFIGKNDIVILKPNCQWWNQGRTNLAAMKGFVDLVLGIPGFNGEVIIAENHHFMDEPLPAGEQDNIRGWTHFSEINGDIDGVNHNMNTLIELYQQQGFNNVTKYHWRDGSAKPAGVWGNGQNGGLVKGSHEGDGYVWTDLEYEFSVFFGIKRWKVKMTYPIFTSRYSGITIDFKNGAYQRKEIWMREG